MDKENQIKSFIEYLLERYDSYHHQKENVSHAGILLQVTVFATIMAISQVDGWFGSIEILWIKILGFSLIWFLLHIFIRVQLRLKRWAALNYAGSFRAYREFIKKDILNKKDIKPKKFPGFPKNRFLIFLDFFIPIGRAQVHSDVGNSDFPAFIADTIQEQYDNYGTGSTAYEWIFTLGSLIMYAISIIRIISL